MIGPTDDTVYHLCTRTDLESARAAGMYRPASLAREGFVHLSRANQVRPTALAYFADVPDVVVLVIDPARLTAPLVYEAPAPLPTATPKVYGTSGSEALYPHAYGPINMDAVIDIVDLAQFA